MKGRPGASLPAADLDAARSKVKKIIRREPEMKEVISYILYPKVFEDFCIHQKTYGNVDRLPTPNFFYGMKPNEEIAVDIEQGKTLIIRFLTVSQPHSDGNRTVFFELNGQPREITVPDLALESTIPKRVKADPKNPEQVGASMPGMVVNVAVEVGDIVKKGRKLLVLEAMKMESTIYAEVEGTVSQVLIAAGSQVETNDLLIEIKS